MYIGLALISIIGTFLFWQLFKELATPIMILVLLAVPTGVSSLVLRISEDSQSKDQEYWGDLLDHLQYDEAYQSYEWNSCCRHEKCCCSTDSKGKESCGSRCVGCYECKDYPARYWKVGISGKSYPIGENEFQRVSKKLGTPWEDKGFYQEVKKSGSCGFNGKRFIVRWDKTKNTAENIASEHTYKNKVRFSSSLYRPETVTETTKTQWGLLEYPQVSQYYQSDVVGYKGFPRSQETSQALTYFNGYYGKSKQIKVLVWVFEGKPKDAGYWQKHYIQNGNKNEYNIILGYYPNGVQWVQVATWCKVPSIENRIKDLVSNGIEVAPLVDSSLVYLKDGFVRTEFTPMNNIIDVEAPMWGIILALIVNVGLIFGIIIFISKNHS